MGGDEAYQIGQRCWFPHETEGFVSGDLVKRETEGEKITLIFKDDAGRVRKSSLRLVIAHTLQEHTIETNASALENPNDASLPALRNPATIESPTIQDLTELSNLK